MPATMNLSGIGRAVSLYSIIYLQNLVKYGTIKIWEKILVIQVEIIATLKI